MMRSPARIALRSEAGFTLVELLAAMAISTIVLIATLTTLDTFSSNAARQTRVTDANDQVRSVMDRVVADLRQATTIEVAGPNDLVYTVTDSATAIRRERICRDGSRRLWRTTATTSAPTAPTAAGTKCPKKGTGALITPLKSVNTAANPMFRYDSATPAQARSVGVTISLDAGNGGRNDTSTLRASAFVRSKGETAAAIDDEDVTATCNSAGQATLTLASSVGSSLGVTYTDLDGNALGSANAGSSLLLTGAGSTVIANITSSAGLVSQLVKEISC